MGEINRQLQRPCVYVCVCVCACAHVYVKVLLLEERMLANTELRYKHMCLMALYFISVCIRCAYARSSARVYFNVYCKRVYMNAYIYKRDTYVLARLERADSLVSACNLGSLYCWLPSQRCPRITVGNYTWARYGFSSSIMFDWNDPAVNREIRTNHTRRTYICMYTAIYVYYIASSLGTRVRRTYVALTTRNWDFRRSIRRGGNISTMIAPPGVQFDV